MAVSEMTISIAKIHIFSNITAKFILIFSVTSAKLILILAVCATKSRSNWWEPSRIDNS